MVTGGAMMTLIGNLPQAENLLRNAYMSSKKVFNGNHLLVANAGHELAICLLKQNRVDEAKQLLTEEMIVRVKVLGQESPLVKAAFNANHLLMQGK
jgi:predicted hydrocarbon binding protein